MSMYNLPNFVAFSVVKNAETICFCTFLYLIFFIIFIQIVCGFSHVLWCYFTQNYFWYIFNCFFNNGSAFFEYYFSSDHSCSIFVLISVLCYHFLNTLQFENKRKKVGTFVKLTFLYWFVSCLTFLVSIFMFPFSFVLLFCVSDKLLWRILSISTFVAMAYVLKKRRFFANRVKVVYS